MPETSTINTDAQEQPSRTGGRLFSSLFRRIATAALLWHALLFTHAPPVLAEVESDRETMELYYEPSDLAVSTATRSPRPLSLSAENITVVTAEEIEAMNAHNLAEVLNRVPGVQIDPRGNLGLFADYSIQGSTFRQILVLVDGVSVSNQVDNAATVAQIPVQNIERVEVVKGPVSSAWGSALAGVISVVTKAPRNTAVPAGTASFSGGENGTRDVKAELTGAIGPLGYYLSGGNLTSNGFQPSNSTDSSNLYAKFLWNLRNKGSVRLTLNYLKGSAGSGLFRNFVPPLPVFPEQDFAEKSANSLLLSTLALNYALTDRLTLDLTVKGSLLDTDINRSFPSSGTPFRLVANDEKTVGTSAILTWRQGIHTLVGGLDFDHGNSKTTIDIPLLIPLTPNAHRLVEGANDKWGIFLNDTVAWERFTLTPALRFDRTSRDGEFWSPSLGGTFALTERTLLRANYARGYSLSIINPDPTATNERVWTIQAGFETSDIPFLWLKADWFRNTVRDVLTSDESGNLIRQKQLREGFEVEARTIPIYNSWLSAGYAFIDARDADADRQLKGTARHTWDLGLHYDDREQFRGSLLGHYIWWNAPNVFPGNIPINAQYKDFIWDLNLGWRFFRAKNAESELFFTGHNLFDGKQFSSDIFTNPHRWLEGGIRVKW